MAATARQIEVYELHKEACIANGHPQTAFYHRLPEGTLTPVGPGGINKSYTFPDPRVTDNPKNAAIMLWVTWEGLQLRGYSQDGGDTMSSRMWNQRFLAQFPAIDDNYNEFTIFDDDFFVNAQNVRFKMENPVLSADGSFWTAVGIVQR